MLFPQLLQYLLVQQALLTVDHVLDEAFIDVRACQAFQRLFAYRLPALPEQVQQEGVAQHRSYLGRALQPGFVTAAGRVIPGQVLLQVGQQLAGTEGQVVAALQLALPGKALLHLVARHCAGTAGNDQPGAGRQAQVLPQVSGRLVVDAAFIVAVHEHQRRGLAGLQAVASQDIRTGALQGAMGPACQVGADEYRHDLRPGTVGGIGEMPPPLLQQAVCQHMGAQALAQPGLARQQQCAGVGQGHEVFQNLLQHPGRVVHFPFTGILFMLLPVGFDRAFDGQQGDLARHIMPGFLAPPVQRKVKVQRQANQRMVWMHLRRHLPQLLQHVGDASALGRTGTPAGLDELAESGRAIRRKRHSLAGPDGAEARVLLVHLFPGTGPLAVADHLPEHQAQRIDVSSLAAVAVAVAAYVFGRDEVAILQALADGAGLGGFEQCVDLGHAKVGQLGPAVLVDQDVLGLQVAMQHALPMQIGQGLADFCHPLPQPGCRNGLAVLLALLQCGLQAALVAELHHQIRRALLVADAVELHDARMATGGQAGYFPFQRFHHFLVR